MSGADDTAPRSEAARAARLFLVAATANLLVLAFVTGFDRLEPGADEEDYFAQALALARGEPFEGLLRTPGWPWLLSWVVRLAGPSVVAAKLFTALLGALTPLLVDRLARPLLGARQAGWAALACALLPTLVWEHATLYTESASTLAFLACQLLLVRAIGVEADGAATTGRRAMSWLLFGGAVAGANLIKPSFVPWVALLPLVGAWAWRRTPARWLRAVAVPTAAFVAVMAPWWIRNYEVSGGHFVPFSTAGDLSLAESNNPVIAAMAPRRARVGERDVVTEPGRFLDGLNDTGLMAPGELKGRFESPAERAAVARARALRWIVSNPRDFARLAVRKLGYAFGLVGCWNEGWAKRLAALAFLAVLALGLPGWWRLGRAGGTSALLLLQPVVFVALAAIFFGSWRYRHPFEPAFVIAAAAGAAAVGERARRRAELSSTRG